MSYELAAQSDNYPERLPLAVPPLTLRELKADERMIPIMSIPHFTRVEGEPRQETHTWHCHGIDADAVDESPDMVYVVPNATDEFLKNRSQSIFHEILSHLPGTKYGWKHYSVLEIDETAKAQDETMHIGWIGRKRETNEVVKAQIQRLPLDTPHVRMLNGSANEEATFFATTNSGIQLPVRCIGRSMLGMETVPQDLKELGFEPTSKFANIRQL